MYAEDYKKQLIEKAKVEYDNQKADMINSAAGLINSAKQKLLDSKKPIVKDLAFELRLNNTLKTIELAGKDMGKDELKTLVEPFKDDYGTMKSLFHIFRSQGMDTDDIIPNNGKDYLDGIDYQVKDLEDKGHSILDGLKYDNSLGMSIAVSMLPDDTEGEE